MIMVDDGIATGATTRAALRSVRPRRNPRRLILAVPVAPASTLEDLRDEADEIVCLKSYANSLARSGFIIPISARFRTRRFAA